MKKLSKLALDGSIDIVEAIKNHPFNVELSDGSLEKPKFKYYIEQDSLYLKDFARSLAMIAARAPEKFMEQFLSFSGDALVAEQEVVHDFFRKKLDIQESGLLSPATIAYTSFLLQACAIAPVEVAIASVLPCFWVYRIVGQSILEKNKANKQNPYWSWIETYASEEFSEGVDNAIKIFDEVAASTSDTVRSSMLDAFYKSTVFEWHFWNDAYKMSVFNAINNKMQ